MSQVVVGELSLGFEAVGPTTGVPLLLLPGLGMRLEHWAAHLPALSARRQVIALDVRGGADSDAPPGPYTIPQLAVDTAGAIDALGLGRVDVLGVSMGGFIAQELATTYPALVRRQVLALTARSPSPRGRERLRLELSLRERPELLELHFRSLFLWLLDDATYARRDAVDRLVRAAVNAAATEPLAGVRGRVAACLDYEGNPRLGEIGAPTLVIGTTGDLVYPPEQTRGLAAAIPGSRHVLLEGAHLLTGPAIRRFDEAVLAFLDESPD